MLVNRLVKYCVGLTFVACLSTIVVYAVHGWEWGSKFAGGRLTLSLPEFVAIVVLVTLVLGICIDYWRTKQVVSLNSASSLPRRS
jgi:F0F1-type ATP synthase assembly protein I